MRCSVDGRTISSSVRRLLFLALVTLALGPRCGHELPRDAHREMVSPTASRSLDEDASGVSKKAFGKGTHADGPDASGGSPWLAFDLDAAVPQTLDRRLLHYSGWLELQVPSPADVIAKASALATASGGYVEHARDLHASLRVPVARFRQVFDAISALGTLLHQSVSVEDLSHAYRDTDLRLTTLRATRDRLQVLLAHSKNEKDRVTILKELESVVEEIDVLETQLATLATLGALSTITLDLRPYAPAIENPADTDIASLRWIHSLGVGRFEVAQSGARLTLPVPEGFVLLSPAGMFRVEAADRTTMWTSRRANEPRGDTAFWVEAIRRRLAPAFASVTTSNAGELQVLELTERGSDPYRYWIAVPAHQDQLDLVEVYFPSEREHDRHRDAVAAAIRAGVP